MKHKVIFDTNTIRSETSVTKFLGGREQLNRFSKIADIVIPDIVLREIQNQKKKHLESKKQSFKSNPFHELLGLKENNTNEYDIDKCINEMKDNEDIPYEVISLTRPLALDDILELCLAHKAPFDENGDKGFKDACIYLAVLEYVESIRDEKIFFVTSDSRLKEAFSTEDRVIVVQDFDEFEHYNEGYFTEDYFLDRISEELGQEIRGDSIEDIFLNFEDN